MHDLRDGFMRRNTGKTNLIKTDRGVREGGRERSELRGGLGLFRPPPLQGSAKKWIPGCVKAAGKAGRSDKQQ